MFPTTSLVSFNLSAEQTPKALKIGITDTIYIIE